MRKFLLMILLLAVSVVSSAQNRVIKGMLQDKDTKEYMELATLQLLRADSTYVGGAVTNELGIFELKAPENGKYLLKISSVGYTSTIKHIEVAEDHDLDMGLIVMKADGIMLNGVTATAQALKVTMVEDTFVYNSAAYRTPEGSAVEELVKLLPGATVDDNGNITINGKQVKKIKMDGKEFMTGDTQTALKNLPTAMVDRVKAYEAKSDRARITGIDDGEDEMTLDFTIKKGMNKGVVGQADLGYGTRDRYAERVMGMLFRDNLRMGLFTNFNNNNSQGFGGRGGGMGRGRNGLNTANMVGLNFNYENTGKLKWDGSVSWNHRTSDSWTRSSSESFVINNQSFSNSLSQNYTKNKSWNGQMRFEWTPDTVTNIMFRPSFSWSDNDSRGGSRSATFDADPYRYGAVDPLDELLDGNTQELLGIARNSRTGSSLSYGSSKNFNGWLQVNRRLSSTGRNITFNASGNYSDSENRNFSTQNVNLYKVQDQNYSTNRYNLTPSKNWGYSAQLSYSEPIADRTYLQFSYKYSQSYSESNRSTHDFSTNGIYADQLSDDYLNLLASLGYSNIPYYRQWSEYLPGHNEEDYKQFDEPNLHKRTEYNTYTHDIEMQFRRVRDNYNFNVGVLAQPQHTRLDQFYLGEQNSVKRNVFNVTPTADFRYYFTRQHQLRFNYRGSTGQPNIADMIEIEDNTDPMNIRRGNAGLKPSFTNRFSLNYNNFIQNHFQSINANVGFNTTRNSTASVTYYNPETGGNITRPENVNGNWDLNAGARYNVAIDSLGVWNFSLEPSYRFSNHVGLANENKELDLAKMTRYSTKQHNFGGRAALSFRNTWLNIEPDVQVNYTKSRNELRPASNLNTWNFSYGANVHVTFPWGSSIASDIHMRSRRGYNDASLNTNELVWNAQVAHSFFAARNLTVSLEFYDILKRQSSFSRMIDAMSRRDTEYNSINSFAMLHVIYRFSIYGGKQIAEQMQQGGRPDFNRPDMQGRPGGTRGMGGPGGYGGPGGGFGGPR